MVSVQEEYWQLVERRIKLEEDWQAFHRQHAGGSFKVFHPEWISRAFTSDVKPLFSDEDVS